LQLSPSPKTQASLARVRNWTRIEDREPPPGQLVLTDSAC